MKKKDICVEDKNTAGFIEDLSNLYGNDLVCIYQYCSAITVNPVNLLVVIEGLDILKLDPILEKSNKYYRDARLIPRFLTPHQVYTGLDVFAIDFYEIKAEGMLMYGKDILSDCEIKTHDLYWQLERDTKAMRMRLLQTLWRQLNEMKAVREILFLNTREIIRLCRVALKLKETDFNDVEDFVRKCADLFKFNGLYLRRLIEFRSLKKKLGRKEAVSLSQDMFLIISALDEYFDLLNK